MSLFAVYDNGGETADRFTIFTNPPLETHGDRELCLALSNDCASPQGVSMCAYSIRGPHLGRAIAWHDLPAHVRDHAARRLNGPLNA